MTQYPCTRMLYMLENRAMKVALSTCGKIKMQASCVKVTGQARLQDPVTALGHACMCVCGCFIALSMYICT